MLSQAAPPAAGPLFSPIRFSGRACVIVAVSGGGDSVALLFLLQDHLKSLPDAPPILAVTVDHRLRPEAAEEARVVAALCAAYGIAHRTVAWRGAKPRTGIAATAREARLDLLACAAVEAGTDLVLTGHTADDQAETLAMRIARGRGRGLAGIAPATLRDGKVWFLRPLLGVRRAALRAYLEGRGIAWIEDPTNRDLRFERVRVRRALEETEIERLNAEAEAAAAERRHAGERAAAFIAEAARLPAPGLLALPRAALVEAAPDVALYAFRILLAIAGGRDHLPDEARAAALLAGLKGEGLSGTLSRAVVTARGGHVHLHREARNLPRVDLGRGIVWDGRYRLSPRRPGPMAVAPFGTVNARAADLPETPAPARLLRAALAAEPALWEGGHCLGLARQRAEVSLEPLAAPWARLLPIFDRTPALAVLGLLGGAPLPPPPWHGHIDRIG